MHQTDMIKQLKHIVNYPKAQQKDKLWIIQTIQVWCVYTQNHSFSLIIDILDTVVQQLIQTYIGSTHTKKKIYLQINSTQTPCMRETPNYIHTCI